MDEWFEQQIFHHVDVMMVHAEGHDPDILDGARNMLESPAVKAGESSLRVVAQFLGLSVWGGGWGWVEGGYGFVGWRNEVSKTRNEASEREGDAFFFFRSSAARLGLKF